MPNGKGQVLLLVGAGAALGLWFVTRRPSTVDLAHGGIAFLVTPAETPGSQFWLVVEPTPDPATWFQYAIPLSIFPLCGWQVSWAFSSDLAAIKRLPPGPALIIPPCPILTNRA